MSRKSNFLRMSFIVWLTWMFSLAILQVSYNNNIITDTMLGEWNIFTLMIFDSYVWIMFYFVCVMLMFGRGKH